VVNRYDYDAFGNAVAANTSEQVENRYRFQGLATQSTTSRTEAEAQENELNIMSPELVMLRRTRPPRPRLFRLTCPVQRGRLYFNWLKRYHRTYRHPNLRDVPNPAGSGRRPGSH
jgi:hypothetical protein